MLITGSSLQLNSSHTYVEQLRQRESLTLWQDGKDGRKQLTIERQHDELKLSAEASALSVTQQSQPSTTTADVPAITTAPAAAAGGAADAQTAVSATAADLHVTVLQLLVERLTGRHIHLFDARTLQGNGNAPARSGEPEHAHHHGDKSQGWGAVYQASQSYYEAESTAFTAQGVVHTADGKEIHLAIDLTMSREFASQTGITLRAGDALKDPLVINLDGTAAQLGGDRMSFDLNADSQAEQVATLAPGSAFLALDKNGDGQVNNGSELFGVVSGNGFADLAQYDEDGNGWIDQGDSIFAQLRLWQPGQGDGATLDSLQTAGVGAIYLGNTATPFSLNDATNAQLGATRASGLYLHEDGTAGTVQQLDLVV